MDLLQSLVDLGRTNPAALALVIIAFIVALLFLGGLITRQILTRGQRKDDAQSLRDQATALLTDKLVTAITDGLGKVGAKMDRNSDIAEAGAGKTITMLSEIQAGLREGQADIQNALELQRVATKERTEVGKMQVDSLNAHSEQLGVLIDATNENFAAQVKQAGKISELVPSIELVLKSEGHAAIQAVNDHSSTLIKGVHDKLDELPASVVRRLDALSAERDEWKRKCFEFERENGDLRKAASSRDRDNAELKAENERLNNAIVPLPAIDKLTPGKVQQIQSARKGSTKKKEPVT